MLQQMHSNCNLLIKCRSLRGNQMLEKQRKWIVLLCPPLSSKIELFQI